MRLSSAEGTPGGWHGYGSGYWGVVRDLSDACNRPSRCLRRCADSGVPKCAFTVGGDPLRIDQDHPLPVYLDGQTERMLLLRLAREASTCEMLNVALARHHSGVDAVALQAADGATRTAGPELAWLAQQPMRPQLDAVRALAGTTCPCCGYVEGATASQVCVSLRTPRVSPAAQLCPATRLSLASRVPLHTAAVNVGNT